MKYLSEKLQSELLPKFTGIKVHNAKMEYSRNREHIVEYNYYRDPKKAWFYDDIDKVWLGFKDFTNKKEAIKFINLINK